MKKIKKYIFLFFVVLLFVPITQSFIKFYQSKPLNGMSVPALFPTFHYKDWKTGTYQKQAEKYLLGNFGFRNLLVRTLNTIDYNIFVTSNTPKVLIGKDQHLFFDYNIEHYLGIRSQKRSKIDRVMLQTDSLMTFLDKNEVKFIFVILPSNAYYYSDKFPAQYDNYKKRPNDYDYYLEVLEEHHINYIDFNQWFLDIKDTVSIDLFPKHGTHYTYSSAVLVADSMLKYMESIKDIDIPDIITNDYSIDSMRYYEHDIENILNLSYDLENEDLLYYNLKFDTVNKTAPKVLTVGDSFYWPVINQLIPLNCFSNVAYWFYNLKVYPESFTKEKHPDEVDLDLLMQDLDYIIIFSSSTLIHNYDYDGFLETMMGFYNGNYSILKKSNQIEFWIQAIKKNPDWYNTIKKKASDNNIPVEQQLIKEAEWMYKTSK